jgi:hypothetical protein
MRTATTALVVLVLASLASTQAMMPLPAFSNTFSSSGYTRGFFFQAPIDFTIVGLRVPDEAKHGLQNVAVYRMAGQPPAYPTTTTGGLQFFKAAEPSASIIPCQIAFKTGEWIGVLGACGDASMMHNSYGVTGTYPSQILGAPVNIDRFGTQTNIVVTQGTGAYWSILNSTVSRVEVYVASTSLTGSGSGTPGSSIVFTLKAPGDAGLPYQMGSSFGNGPIPIDTRTLELSPDNLLVLSTSGLAPTVFQAYAGLLDAQGLATANLAIPNYPVLKGIRIYTAFLTLKASAPSGIGSISPAFLFTIQ